MVYVLACCMLLNSRSSWFRCRIVERINIAFCNIFLKFIETVFCLQCFDAVGWAAGRASGL